MLSLPEIARELYVSPNTVKTQCNAIYRKLAVASRQAAVKPPASTACSDEHVGAAVEGFDGQCIGSLRR